MGHRGPPPDLSRHGHTLAEEYLLQDGVFWLRVRPGSPSVGRQQAALDLREYPALALVGIQAGNGGGPVNRTIQPDDLLIVRGDAETVGRLAADHGLGIRTEPEPGLDEHLDDPDVLVVDSPELVLFLVVAVSWSRCSGGSRSRHSGAPVGSFSPRRGHGTDPGPGAG